MHARTHAHTHTHAHADIHTHTTEVSRMCLFWNDVSTVHFTVISLHPVFAALSMASKSLATVLNDTYEEGWSDEARCRASLEVRFQDLDYTNPSDVGKG